MASGPITLWQIDGETMETVTDFIFLGWGTLKSRPIVNAAMKLKDACSLGIKIMTNLDSILKSRAITLPTKIQNYGFPCSHV